ncbi:MAG: hypothetical protein GTO53_07610 [Planctomycetales bacterium]|nr:hypothetical protein [Planctomycetales bacterium]NIM09003.1 hypothetical protein [Planctomycetales bacterium]NIN08466.1 hypothetical protein [Planctomycetales bacterium]NIN77600.1 hypothetical protein [Planctomycetales bacterium]NIO34765.1 hypothetical protein [Planctomycetales bacterium]
MTIAKATSAPPAAAGDLPTLWTWLRLPILLPLTLWATEVVILSPYVEFKVGAMRYLAHPLTANLAFLSTILFLLLAADGLGGTASLRWSWQRIAWLAANLAGYGLLFQVTLRLHNLQQKITGQESLFRWLAVAWVVLAIWVGITAWLAFVPSNKLATWLRLSWHQAFTAVLLAFTLFLITPEIRKLWYFIHQPIVGLTLQLLALAGYSEPVCYFTRSAGNPVFGCRDAVILEVTPFCAEVESLATFCLLSGALLLAGGKEIHRTRFCLVVFGGLVFLYLLNALRLYLIIDVATRLNDAQIAVSLAHSRLSHVVFLTLSLFILIGTRRWWSPGPTAPEAVLQTSPG